MTSNQNDSVFRFRYQPPSGCRTSTSKRSREFSLAGPGDDHVMLCVRDSRTFYEPDLLEHIGRMLDSQDGIVFDVGANLGNHTMYFAGVLGLRTYSVEPCDLVLKYLELNVAENELSQRVTIVRTAVSDKPGTATMKVMPGNLGMTQIQDGSTGDASEYVVPVETLDHIWEKECSGKQVKLIKIDVEGLECSVLRGARSLLETHQPIVSIEMSVEAGVDPAQTLLEELGYDHIGPFGFTPTCLFFHPDRVSLPGGLSDFRYRFWRSRHRGRLHKLLVRFGMG